MDKCEECGFEYGTASTAEVAKLIERHVAEIVVVLVGTDEDALRTRPGPNIWSALEYGCHVRDVLLVQRDRALLALVEEKPGFVPMYRDERVENAGYSRENAWEVSDELRVAAHLFAKLALGMNEEQLRRRCIYNFPAPAERDVSWVFSHTLHEVVHHEKDIHDVLGSGGAG